MPPSHQWFTRASGGYPFRGYGERRDLLLAWLPNAEPFELRGATHLLQAENPGAMAEALAAFFSRHLLG
jgi:pimeloyl-ACP methyl ester carboxylesterase